MPEDTTQVAGAGAGGTGQAAPTTTAQPTDWEVDANPYKTRFVGLQGKYQQEQAKWKADSGKLFDATEALTKLTGEKEGLAAEFSTLRGQHAELTDKLGVQEEKFTRLQTIALEFPDLLGFEKDGLLPDGTGDELKTKLTNFRAKLGSAGQAAAVAAVAGASPATPVGQVTKTSDDLWKQCIADQKAGNFAAYEKHYQEYMDSLKEKK